MCPIKLIFTSLCLATGAQFNKQHFIDIKSFFVSLSGQHLIESRTIIAQLEKNCSVKVKGCLTFSCLFLGPFYKNLPETIIVQQNVI